MGYLPTSPSLHPKALFKRLAPILQAIHQAMDGHFFLSFSIYISRSMDMEPEDFKKIVEAMPPDTNPQTMDTLYDKLMAKGRAEGIEQGREKGREEGREEGREKGLEEGSELAKKEAILSGFRLGIPVQVLSLMTGYAEQKVLQILQETVDG
jgi:flagellar biosynthesis/type III secretory pathway protein FliH